MAATPELEDEHDVESAVRHGEQNLSLAPAPQVVVEVKASRKGDKEKVAFELEWRCSGEGAAPSNG